jgi:hypothetical protein
VAGGNAISSAFQENRESKLSHSKTTFSTNLEGSPEPASTRNQMEIKKQ